MAILNTDVSVVITDAGAALLNALQDGERLPITSFGLMSDSKAEDAVIDSSATSAPVFVDGLTTLSVSPIDSDNSVIRCSLDRNQGPWTIGGVALYSGTTLFAMYLWPNKWSKPAGSPSDSRFFELVVSGSAITNRLAVASTALPYVRSEQDLPMIFTTNQAKVWVVINRSQIESSRWEIAYPQGGQWQYASVILSVPPHGFGNTVGSFYSDTPAPTTTEEQTKLFQYQSRYGIPPEQMGELVQAGKKGFIWSDGTGKLYFVEPSDRLASATKDGFMPSSAFIDLDGVARLGELSDQTFLGSILISTVAGQRKLGFTWGSTGYTWFQFNRDTNTFTLEDSGVPSPLMTLDRANGRLDFRAISIQGSPVASAAALDNKLDKNSLFDLVFNTSASARTLAWDFGSAYGRYEISTNPFDRIFKMDDTVEGRNVFSYDPILNRYTFNVPVYLGSEPLATSSSIDLSSKVSRSGDSMSGDLTFDIGTGETKGIYFNFTDTGNNIYLRLDDNYKNLTLFDEANSRAILTYSPELGGSIVSEANDFYIGSVNAVWHSGNFSPSLKADITGDSGGLRVPFGTVAERPAATSDDRFLRYNTDNGNWEGWDGSAWSVISPGSGGGSGLIADDIGPGTFTGAFQFSIRPSFGAETPWDSGNFDPNSKFDVAGGIVTGASIFQDEVDVEGTLTVGDALVAEGEFFYGKSSKLPAAFDLDTLLVPGTYEGDNLDNAPSTDPYYVIVGRHADNDEDAFQILIERTGNPPAMMIRNRISTVWTDWFTFWHSGNITPVNKNGDVMGGTLVVSAFAGARGVDSSSTSAFELQDNTGYVVGDFRWNPSTNSLSIRRKTPSGDLVDSQIDINSNSLQFSHSGTSYTVLLTEHKASVSNILNRVTGKYVDTDFLDIYNEVSIGTTSGTINPDHNLGINFKVTLTNDAVLGLISNARQRRGTIRVVKGTNTLTFDSSWRFQDGLPPTGLAGTIVFDYMVDSDGNQYILNTYNNMKTP